MYVTKLRWLAGLALAALACAPAQAQVVQEYGDEDLVGFGYPAGVDPKAGATLYGLSAGVVTTATNSYQHSFPFSPSAGDYAGTDQIYVGSNQIGASDGYAASGSRINGPQVFNLNYGASIPTGQTIQTLTLGIAADDFQFGAFGQPFTASINGVVNTALTNALNGLNQTGPFTQFLTVGIDPASLTGSNVLTLSIDEGGNGSDGWAVDYLTVGLTFAPSSVPEPSSVAFLLASGLTSTGMFARRRRLRKAR